MSTDSKQSETTARVPFAQAPTMDCWHRMKRALEAISAQLTSDELAANHDHEGAPDYETSHDEMIRAAREALS